MASLPDQSPYYANISDSEEAVAVFAGLGIQLAVGAQINKLVRTGKTGKAVGLGALYVAGVTFLHKRFGANASENAERDTSDAHVASCPGTTGFHQAGTRAINTAVDTVHAMPSALLLSLALPGMLNNAREKIPTPSGPPQPEIL